MESYLYISIRGGFYARLDLSVMTIICLCETWRAGHVDFVHAACRASEFDPSIVDQHLVKVEKLHVLSTHETLYWKLYLVIAVERAWFLWLKDGKWLALS